MPSPLDALRKASSIGPDPQGITNLRPEDVVQQAMPLGPWTGAFPGANALAGLKNLIWPAAKGIASTAAPLAHQAMETLGEISPSHTPVGGEQFFNIGRGMNQTQQNNPLAEAAFAKYVRKP